MTLDRTRWPELLVGLDRVEVLEVVRGEGGRLLVRIETTDAVVGCAGCGTRAVVKDRSKVVLADLPAFGSPVRLVWMKRRWSCPEPDCGVGSFVEDRPDIAPARAVMITRAGLWATREVGAEVHTVAYVAAQLGVGWHTVMDTVSFWAEALIEDPDRVGETEAVGVDETKYLAATRDTPPQWISAVCDINERKVIDIVEGRYSTGLDQWLDKQPAAWTEAVQVSVTDLHPPFRRTLAKHLPNATAVADPFHVVGVATRVVDRTRRRVQQETFGHRGRKHDPLYRSRKLLTVAEERLDDTGRAKLTGLLAAGDPNGEVHEAWVAKEAVRDLYTMWDREPAARGWLNGLIEDCRDGKSPEVRGMARTLAQWHKQILAWHTTGASNGPVEGLNSMIKKVKRVAAGFRNLANYRTRILLAVGGCNWSLLGTQPR